MNRALLQKRFWMTSTGVKLIRGIAISDLHLGCPRVPAAHTHQALQEWLYPQLTDNLDILFISGDFFDTLLDMDGKAGYVAVNIINDLYELAVKHKFYIRILRGTFKHDRRQVQFFNLNETLTLHKSPQILVVDEAKIEYISALNLHVMYLPDELHDDIYSIINCLLKQHRLTQVDFIINHGYFEHLLPKGIPHIPKNTLNLDRVQTYVKGCIFNGHVHTANVYRNVINVGSFDRLAHGEESPKGYFKFTYDFHKVQSAFVENKSASWFKTYTYDEHTTLNQFIKWVEAQHLRSDYLYHLRLYGPDRPIRVELETYIQTKYDLVRITRKLTNEVSTDMNDVEDTDEVELLPLTEQNLPNTIEQFLDYKLTLNEINEILNELT